jgi:hypothetical protein
MAAVDRSRDRRPGMSSLPGGAVVQATLLPGAKKDPAPARACFGAPGPPRSAADEGLAGDQAGVGNGL